MLLFKHSGLCVRVSSPLVVVILRSHSYWMHKRVVAECCVQTQPGSTAIRHNQKIALDEVVEGEISAELLSFDDGEGFCVAASHRFLRPLSSGFLLFLQGFINYARIRKMADTLSTLPRTRVLFIY